MNKERLTALSMFQLKNMISQIRNFNKTVIEKFCQGKNRKIIFLIKQFFLIYKFTY